VVSTFGKLDSFNPDCNAAPCSMSEVEYDFADLEQTVAHEIGHYLGLNHPSEAKATQHDLVKDTPICTTVDSLAGNRISISSCLNTDSNVYADTGLTCKQSCTSYNAGTGVYCSTKPECQFNYLMYWSSKYFTEGVGTGDGSLITPYQGGIMNFSPLVQ
jgi:hypothetical protein